MQNLIRAGRDSRIDFFRGVALWSILIDHMIKSWLRAITLKNFAFCDNTEVFVLLSGFSVGIAYRKSILHSGPWVTAGKALRRAIVIYRVHLLMALLFLAEAGFLISYWNPDQFLDLLNLKPFVEGPFAALQSVVLLQYQPKFLDILPLYMALLLMLCPLLPLLQWPRWLFAGSLVLYLATLAFQWELPWYLGSWTLNPLAWQSVFLTGVLAASLFRQKANTYSRVWDLLAAMYALFGFFESNAKHLAGHVPSVLLLQVTTAKHDLHPLRLLNIFALTWLTWRYIPASAVWLHSRLARYFTLLGQHSLPVFASSVLFSTLGWAILAVHPGWVSQLVTQGVGSLAILAVALLAARQSHKPGSQKTPHTHAETKAILTQV